MTDHDELLRTVLADEADSVSPRLDWDDVVTRSHARASTPRRPVLLAAAAAVVLAFVGGYVLSQVTDDDQPVIADDGPDTSAPEPTTPTTGPATSTTTTIIPEDTTATTFVPASPVVLDPAAPVALPTGARLGEDELVVARLVDGDETGNFVDIDVVSATDGRVLRTLAGSFSQVEGGIIDLTLTPDRTTLFFVSALNACESGIYAVPVDGSAEPVQVAVGERVAVSPDGESIAYTRPIAYCDIGDPALIVHVLGTGERLGYGGAGGSPVSAFPMPEDADPSTLYGLDSLAWIDGSTVAVIHDPVPDDQPSRLVVLDLATSVSLFYEAPGVATDRIVIPGPDGSALSYRCCNPAANPEASLVLVDAGGDGAAAPVTIAGGAVDIALESADLGGRLAVRTDVGGQLLVDGTELRTDVILVAW